MTRRERIEKLKEKPRVRQGGEWEDEMIKGDNIIVYPDIKDGTIYFFDPKYVRLIYEPNKNRSIIKYPKGGKMYMGILTNINMRLIQNTLPVELL